MTSIHEAIRQLFSPPQALRMGIYHFQSPPDDPRNYRLHLRIEADGSGLLIVNASTILHLNQTAAEYAFHFIQQTPKEEIGRQISKRYNVKLAKAIEDFDDFASRIESLINTPDLDPEIFLGFDQTKVNHQNLSAPLRLDCAVTYSLRPNCDPSFAPINRVKQELSTMEWITILEKAWQAGIPHVIFTGGEPTLRSDLADLIQKSESLGQVTGLLTDGLSFLDRDFTDKILKTGLDHIMFLLQPDKDDSWFALKQLVEQDIFVAVHLTIMAINTDEILHALIRLSEMGLKSVSLSASDRSLELPLQSLRSKAAEMNLSIVSDLPVPYSALNPVALELEQSNPSAGNTHSWLYIEPDGDVLDSQGQTVVRGNLSRDDLDKVWRRQ